MIGILKTTLRNIDKDFFAVQNLNQLVNTNTTNCLFCDDIDMSFRLQLKTNVLQRIHAFDFKGIIITDDLERTQDLIYTTYAKKRFVYLYHLEWTYITDLRFNQIKNVMLNNNIELIARSDTHAKLIEELFKKPKYIMPEWDYKTLIEIDQHE